MALSKEVSGYRWPSMMVLDTPVRMMAPQLI